jgi:hypothetical protein
MIYPAKTTFDKAVDDFITEGREIFQPSSGYQNLTLYLNYGKGDEGPAAWYSEANLGPLSNLKSAWGPQDQFHFNCPIPLL